MYKIIERATSSECIPSSFCLRKLIRLPLNEYKSEGFQNQENKVIGDTTKYWSKQRTSFEFVTIGRSFKLNRIVKIASEFYWNFQTIVIPSCSPITGTNGRIKIEIGFKSISVYF